MELGQRNILSGLEGSGKSSLIFETLEKVASVEQPVLFGVKNYTLMEEQIESWSERYKIPKKEFAICGLSTFYERAMRAYTNKEHPFLLGSETRFVFTTQAQIQRNNHKKFRTAQGDIVNWLHIVIDEFDFTNSIIPTLDFYFSRIQEFEESKELERKKYEWIAQNYTIDDVTNLQLKQKFKNEGFTVAYWLKDTKCPLTFLSSEILAKELLLALPESELLSETFKEYYVESPEYKNCVVHTFSFPYVNSHFFEVMNKKLVWDTLGFDYIISDNLLSWYDKHQENCGLSITKVVPHLGARGSNLFRNNKILTVLSHIPKQKIKELFETFKYFGKEKTFEEVETLFYRDRLCQAVGRVLGNRGSKETHLIISEQLKDSILKTEFPYSFNFDWELNFEDKPTTLKRVEDLTLLNQEVRKESRTRQQAISFSLLENHFEIDFDSTIPVSEIKEYCVQNNLKGLSLKNKNTITATKIVGYFQGKLAKSFKTKVSVKNVRIDRKTMRCVVGLKIKSA
jgi:hypothetical protein